MKYFVSRAPEIQKIFQFQKTSLLVYEFEIFYYIHSFWENRENSGMPKTVKFATKLHNVDEKLEKEFGKT